MNDKSLPNIGAMVLAQMGVKIDTDLSPGAPQPFPGETPELVTRTVQGLIHSDLNCRRHPTLYNGGVCGYRYSFRRNMYLWNENEPIQSDAFRVAIYAIVVRDTKEENPENGLRFEVRPIVGQRRHPWHPAEGGTFQQLCRGDYILLRIGVMKDHVPNGAFVSDSVFKYTEDDQVELLSLETLDRFGEFFDITDELAAQYRDTRFYTEKMMAAIKIPYNPYLAPTEIRRDWQETQKLINKFDRLLSIIFKKGGTVFIKGPEETAKIVNAEEFAKERLKKNFENCARNTAHQFWASAITQALANAKLFKIHPPEFTMNFTGDEQSLKVKIGKRELNVDMTLWNGLKVRATYADPKKQCG